MCELPKSVRLDRDVSSVPAQKAMLGMVVVLTLALCIGAAATVFKLLDALFLRPLPVREPREIVLLSPTSTWGSGWMSFQTLEALRQSTNVFGGIVAQDGGDQPVNIEYGGGIGGFRRQRDREFLHHSWDQNPDRNCASRGVTGFLSNYLHGLS
jgi:hypothetical protein